MTTVATINGSRSITTMMMMMVIILAISLSLIVGCIAQRKPL